MSGYGLTVGVFDSGVGGENVAEAIKKALPNAAIVCRDDRKNLPYGNKSSEELGHLMRPIINAFMQEDKVDAIVIACNTAATNCLQDIKQMVKVPVVGFVPMVKPAAAQTKSGVITVCATPGTLQSARYKELKEDYCGGFAKGFIVNFEDLKNKIGEMQAYIQVIDGVVKCIDINTAG